MAKFFVSAKNFQLRKKISGSRNFPLPVMPASPPVSAPMPTPTVAQIRQQIEKAAAYIRGENKAKLEELLDGAIVMATLTKWIKNIDSIQVTRPSTRFYNKMLHIPDFKSFNADKIYKMILVEAKIGYSVQKLLPYAGLYEFNIAEDNPVHNGFSFVGIKVTAETAPYKGFAGFQFTYKSPFIKKRNVNNTEVPHDFQSDGFVFYRGDRIYFMGTAEDTSFLAYVKQVKHPDKQALEGRMIFECDADGSFVDTNFFLTKRHIPRHK